MSEQQTGRIRASDGEREEVVSALREAIGEGRLTLAEGEERIAAVYAVTYRDELPRHTADLPRPAGPPPRTGPHPARTGPRPPRSGRSRRRPGIGLIVLAAVLAGFLVTSAGGPVWPVVLLGILALMIAKRARPCLPSIKE